MMAYIIRCNVWSSDKYDYISADYDGEEYTNYDVCRKEPIKAIRATKNDAHVDNIHIECVEV